MKDETRLAPLSERAWQKLRDKKFRLGFLARFISHYQKERRKILLENTLDYRLAIRIKTALDELAKADAIGMSVVENLIGDRWHPFRVEHALSGSLRGKYHGWYSGSFSGVVSPNMLESSSVLFLQNDEGRTLRILIPTQDTGLDMLLSALSEWTGKAGYNGWTNTHTSSVIRNSGVSRALGTGLKYASTIDALDASCQRPVENRPVVRVRGILIQDGVALATELEVNGVRTVLLPTAFFFVLAGKIESIARIRDAKQALVPFVR